MDPPDACLVCGRTDWVRLPDPHPHRAVRSDCSVVEQPLAKVQCRACGMVRRIDLGTADVLHELYADQYDIYGNRPRAEEFNTGRYDAIAGSFGELLGGQAPGSVLEIGCGNGSTLAALATTWPTSELAGIEPTRSAVEVARARGLRVHHGMAGGDLDTPIVDRFDLVVSLNVLEHTDDPCAFVAHAAAMVAPGGRLLLACPDSDTPWMELLLADHLYSLTRANLRTLVRRCGFVPVDHVRCPSGLSPDNVQMLLSERGVTATEEADPEPTAIDRLLDARIRYLGAWRELDERLGEATAAHDDLIVFGTGGWCALLATHAPELWRRVRACTIDGGSSATFHGKMILDYAHLVDDPPDCVVLGINPAIQERMGARLRGDGLVTVGWRDLIEA